MKGRLLAFPFLLALPQQSKRANEFCEQTRNAQCRESKAFSLPHNLFEIISLAGTFY
jgi:hypothetical protein